MGYVRLASWVPAHVLANPRALCAAGLLACTGVPWAVRMTVPYAVTAKNYPGDALANASVSVRRARLRGQHPQL